MNEKMLSRLTRLAILLIGVCGVLSCLLWVPISTENATLRALPWRSYSFLIQYVFHWCVSLPCFLLLGLAWRVTANMNCDGLFMEENARYVGRAAVILIFDDLAFLIGNVIFAALGWNRWLTLHIPVAVTGLVLAIFMYVLSQYLARAAALQEESDLTV